MSFSAFKTFCDCEKIKYCEAEPMNRHTSFKIGGPADIFVSAQSVEELARVIGKAKELGIPYYILGKGSNLLVSDKGIRGVVISILNLNSVTVSGEEIIAESGASLASVCVAAKENGLTGLEFAYGIPGAVGGALYMNAGAYSGEMSQVVKNAECIDSEGNIITLDVDNMCLGYRTSIFKQNGAVITSVTFKLQKGNKDEINAAMEEFLRRRKEKQPLEYPSAGSTFKRPTGYFAGALIEKNGLKGASVGGAMVSEKHAGFVINYNNATAADVKNLMQKISETVFSADGVKLEPEVIFIGEQ